MVVALHRPSGLTAEDRAYRPAAGRPVRADPRAGPADILRVLGPGSKPAIADRLISKDRTLELIAVPLDDLVRRPLGRGGGGLAPGAGRPARPRRARPGLDVRWTGDAVIGRDYMRNVQTSLDRAALATVVLLLGVLLFVYRSFLLALVPLATIGICVVISRGVLAWLATAGWEISPLVELFLIVLLFGSGTDFCLFVSWRFGEHWDAEEPGRGDAGHAPSRGQGADDQRRDRLRRPDADGDDPVQAVLQHRAERGDGPGRSPWPRA